MKNSNKPATIAMSERKGPLIINLKNYLEISGDKALSLTREAERVSESTDIEIIISPPQPLLAWIAKKYKIKCNCTACRYTTTRAKYWLFNSRDC